MHSLITISSCLWQGSSHYDVAMFPRVAAAGLGCKMAGRRSECCWVRLAVWFVEDVLLQLSTGHGGAALTPRETRSLATTVATSRVYIIFINLYMYGADLLGLIF